MASLIECLIALANPTNVPVAMVNAENLFAASAIFFPKFDIELEAVPAFLLTF